MRSEHCPEFQSCRCVVEVPRIDEIPWKELAFPFVPIVLKISLRANIEEFNRSLENIGSIDVLGDSNSR